MASTLGTRGEIHKADLRAANPVKESIRRHPDATHAATSNAMRNDPTLARALRRPTPRLGFAQNHPC